MIWFAGESTQAKQLELQSEDIHELCMFGARCVHEHELGTSLG